jgi:LemA protein
MFQNKKMWIIVAVIAAIVIYGFSTYNGMVGQDENANKEWANVQTQYQRRSDLIPNLVQVVKGYAKHEQETLEGVIAARAKATQITVDPTNLTPEKLQQFQQAQGELSSALGRLMAVSEAYPDLKANENFKELQSQLEGTENRIAEARKRYNDAVQTYNVSVRKFPANIFAGIFGFQRRTSFEADASAQSAPKINFDK